MTQDKRVMLDADALAVFDNVELRAHLMTERDTRYFATMITILAWRTRWTSVFSNAQFDIIQAEVSTAIERLLQPVDICDLIIDCVQNDPRVFDAIAQEASRRGWPPPSSGSTPAGGAPDSVLVGGCNLDAIYGQAVAIEDQIHAVSLDFIEIVTNAPGTIASILRAIDIIPVLGDFPFTDDLNDLITWLQTQGASTFTAGYTTTLRQDNICAMFEVACTDCELSMTDILDVYVTGGNIAYAFNDPLRLLAQAVIGNVAPTAFVYAVMAFVAGALSTGGEVFGLVGLKGLQTTAATGTPSSDHTLLCNPCPNFWCYSSNLQSSLDIWTILAPNGIWQSGVGVVQDPNNPGEFLINMTTVGTFDVTDFTLELSQAFTGDNPGFQLRGFNNGVQVFIDVILASQQTYTWSGSPQTVDELRIYLDTRYGSSTLESWPGAIVETKIEGQFTNPFPSNNC